MYSLTQLTGRKRNADRTVVIATVEASKRTWVSGILGAIAGGVLVSPLMLIWTPVPLLGAIVGAFGGVVLFTKRSSKGLRQEYYRQIRDRQAAKRRLGHLMMCRQPVDTTVGVTQILPSSIRVGGDDYIGGEAPEIHRFHATDPSSRRPLSDTRRADRPATHTALA